MSQASRRRLFIRPGGIGDCILSFPAMQFARVGYSEVWTPSTVVPLVHWADRAASIASTGIDLFGVGDLPPDARLLARLREFDSIVSWYGANRAEFRAAAEHHNLPFQFFPALPPPSSEQHAIDFFAAQLGAPPGLAPKLPVNNVAKRDSVVIHPFSGSAKKNWPLDNFRELARRLPIEVEWLAGPEEKLEGPRQFSNLWNAARWIACARLYVGNDSGITHMAAATGVPVLALFGPSDPNVWAPRGANVTVMRSEPIRVLPVSAILQEVRRVLTRA